MNNFRRKDLKNINLEINTKIIKLLNNIFGNIDEKTKCNVINNLKDVAEDLSFVEEEEQMAFDNMPEGLQYSFRGQEIEENINMLNEQCYEIEYIINSLEDNSIDAKKAVEELKKVSNSISYLILK